MGWREEFSRLTGPGLLLGVTFEDLVWILAKNRFCVPPRYWPKVAFAAAISTLTTPIRLIEDAIYSRRVASQAILPPLFIIGHWRSGTTHLHNLFSIDDRFAYGNFAQIAIPNTFLVGERLMAAGSSWFLPRERMGLDNVALHAGVPWEEENALCLKTFLSPYLGWVFPSRMEYYDRYLTFEGVPAKEVDCWKKAFVWLLKKLNLKMPRPLVLKSPPNTCRIKLILEMFPDARFVHVHRDPYVVYLSTMHLHRKMFENYSLQNPDHSQVHGRVIRNYATMYESYFAERSLIPKAQFSEVSYASLDADPLGEVRRIYGELNLPDFSVVEPTLKTYVDSLAGYEKNKHREMAPEVRSEIGQAWRRTFDEWGYPL